MINEHSRIAYKNEQGGVSIVSPAPKSHLERVLGPLTQDEYEKHLLERSLPEGVSYTVLSSTDVPEDRTFRNAWALELDGITVDMPTAKELHIDSLRVLRKPVINATDVEFRKALEKVDFISLLGKEIGGPIEAIKAKTQALRDVTEVDLSSVKTPEELKQAVPEVLKGDG